MAVGIMLFIFLAIAIIYIIRQTLQLAKVWGKTGIIILIVMVSIIIGISVIGEMLV